MEKDMKNRKNEKGAVMVEATIYMPLVLCTVMALLYLALFNMQEYMLMYQAQRAAAVVSREEAYLGYEKFGMGDDNEIDFDWGEGNVPSDREVTAYYEAYHNSMKALYRGIGRLFSGGGARMDYSARFSDAARESAVIVLGNISNPEIQVERGFLGTEVKVTIRHSLPVPGILKYLNYEGGTTIRAAAYSYSVNPSEFVRNVDLAVDLVSYIMKKFGLGDNYSAFLEKTNKVLDMIL